MRRSTLFSWSSPFLSSCGQSYLNIRISFPLQTPIKDKFCVFFNSFATLFDVQLTAEYLFKQGVKVP